MRLFIAEKPSLAEAIAKGLGSADKQRSCFVCGNDVVTWCFGHILEQYAPQGREGFSLEGRYHCQRW